MLGRVAVSPRVSGSHFKPSHDTPWTGNGYFNGSIEEVATYPTALVLTTVQKHYAAAL